MIELDHIMFGATYRTDQADPLILIHNTTLLLKIPSNFIVLLLYDQCLCSLLNDFWRIPGPE